MLGVQCLLCGRPAGCIFDHLINFNQSSIICSLQKCFFVKLKGFLKSFIKRFTVGTHIAESSEHSPS